MKLNTKITLILVVIAVAGFAYWEYAHTTCAETARNFVNDNIEGKNALDLQRAYDLSYKVCMDKRGF